MGAPGGPRAPGAPLTQGESGARRASPGDLVDLLGTATGSEALGLSSATSALDPILGAAIALSAFDGGSGVGFAPIPFGAYSLNEGTTGGVLAPIWFTNAQGEIEELVTPIASYNRIFGVEAGAHVAIQTPGLTIGAGAVVSSKVARNLYFEVLEPELLDTPIAVELFAKNEVDPASRFYGFGPDTKSSGATNDTHRETVLRLATGLVLTPRLELFWRQRVRDVTIGDGRVPSLPSTPRVFPDAPGIRGATIWGTGAELRWDMRDEAFLPRNGILAALVLEANFGLRGDTQSFYPRLVADARFFFTPLDGPVTFAARVRGEALAGTRVPFYELAILGGRNSLRAFGEDRFTDLLSALLQLEARITVLDTRILGTRTIFQVVPFFDEGRVFRSLRSLGGRWQWSPGCGFRLAVPVSVVARVDVTYGSDGANVFAGLGLPF